MSEQLVRVPGGQFAHLRGCPHVVGREVVPVAEREDVPPCRWTGDELAGQGRIIQKSLDAALERYGVSPLTRPLIRERLKDVQWDTVYLPRSESYIALMKDERPVAWAGKTYVQVGDQFEPLPDHRAGAGGGLGVSELWGEPCPTCWTERARNGTCSCSD